MLSGEDLTWLENAQHEHDRLPFRAILARANPTAHLGTLLADEVDASAPGWTAPRTLTPGRSATEMVSGFQWMLRIAREVIFVDPYFRPGEMRCRRPLEAFLGAIAQNRPVNPPSRIEVHTSLSYERAASFSHFRSECERILPRCVPEHMQVSVLVLSQRVGGERLHNRYILTDIGGLTFGIGLDDGTTGETDDITLMDRAQYELRWSQYAAAETMAFEVADPPIEIRSRRSRTDS
jgi:hypothetical protein